MYEVACIIPSTARGKALPYLKKCITSLNNSAKNYVKIRILVVSGEPSAKREASNLKVERILIVEEKLGFAGMNNLALEEIFKKHLPDYILLINDDARVGKSFFARLVEILKHSKPEVICPLVYGEETSKVDSFGIEYFRSGYAKTAKRLDIKTTLAPAACLLVKASFLRRMKGLYGFCFNPILYSYYEDVEFSIRVLMMGGNIKKDDGLIARHFGSLSYGRYSPLVIYYSLRNLVWVIILTWPKVFIFRNFLKIFFIQALFFLEFFRIYPKLFFDTFVNLKRLVILRGQIVPRYQREIDFEKLLSRHTFRTRRLGIVI